MYNLKQIAFEVESTALGDAFYGNALRVAKDIPGVTQEERNLLDAWLTGDTQHWHRLLDLAIKIRLMEEQ